jgi:hypothetical protein
MEGVVLEVVGEQGTLRLDLRAEEITQKQEGEAK